MAASIVSPAELGRLRPSYRAEVRATLALAGPLVLTNAAQFAFGVTDTLLLGRLGADALAAGALAANLHFAVLIFGIGALTAVSSLVAADRGRDPHALEPVRATVRQGFLAALALTVPVWLAMWNGEAILRALGQEPALASAAGTFLRALMGSVPFFLGFLVLRSFLAALERPGWTLVVGLLAVPLNAALAYALVFGRLRLPALGLAGPGMATSLASLFMFAGLAVVCIADPGLRRYRLFSAPWRVDWARTRDLWRLGAPVGLTMAFEVLIFNAAALLMGLLGAAELAAHSIALQIATVAFMVPLGLSQAATVRVGLAYGAGDPRGVRVAGWTALGLGTAFALLTMAVIVLRPLPLVGLFTDVAAPGNAALVALTLAYLSLAGLFQVADSVQAVAAGALRGLQDTRTPMLLVAAGFWLVAAPLGATLALRTPWRGVGVWTGLAVGLLVVAVLLLARWMSRLAAIEAGTAPAAPSSPGEGLGPEAWRSPP